MTMAEKKLWGYLRKGRTMGVKFRRQHPISRFISDFYCHQAKLVIEIDGGYHYEKEQAESDKGRQVELENLGLMVIRFRNEEITENVEDVLSRIRIVLRERGDIQFMMSPSRLDPIPPAPLPQTGIDPIPPDRLPG